MKIKVRCFASVRELLGADLLDIEVPDGTTLQGLKDILAADAPDLLRLPLAQAVNRAYETTLAEGIKFERRVFHATFATADQKEGMAAFAEKRPANWQHR